MDTITHGITGALVAKSFFSERQGRLAALAVTAGSVFPDTDFLANVFVANPLARLEIHRGITHSVVALPVFALLLGVLTCLWSRQRKFLLLSCLYGVGIAVHILLDVITSFGTMVWAPLSWVRVSWDLTFVIDLSLTAIVLLPQLLAWTYSAPSRATMRGVLSWVFLMAPGVAVAWLASRLAVPLAAATVAAAGVLAAGLLWIPSWKSRGFHWQRASYCRVGVVALAVYLGLCAIAHRAALARVEEFAKKSGASVEHLAALPAPPSLWRWSGLVQTPGGIYRVPIHLADSRSQPLPAQFFANAEQNPYLRAAGSLAEVRTYLWFARFPWVSYRQDNGFHIVQYTDIQFVWPARSSIPPFTFQVFLDGQGRVVRSGLLEP